MTEFETNEETGLIDKCPAGHTPIRSALKKGQMTAHFDKEVCKQCEHFNTCHSKEQKKDCVVRISTKSVDVAERRVEMMSHRKENVSMRAGIEGTNSAIKRTGLNDIQVRGLIKSTIVSCYIVTAQNIKRVIRFMQGGYVKKVPLTN